MTTTTGNAMPRARRSLWQGRSAAILLLLGILPLGGCEALVLGGVVVGATVAAQDRPVKTAIADSAIQADVGRRLIEFDVDVFRRVDIEVVEGKVLLNGVVPSPEDRIDAARIAWQADGVAEVINELEVQDTRSLSDAARDSWITTKLRSAILFDGEVQSINYSIDTVNGTVYLMGIAQNQGELDRVVGHARNIDYVRRVVPYVRIASPAEGG
ncbi:MAG: BON domain-containing protein [Rhodospirillales bacterium]|nr:MAG: BON domain-containing protein [Rhodospirillales bacterium]